MFGKLVTVINGKHTGFEGWVIFEYPNEDRIVLESSHYVEPHVTVSRYNVEFVYSDNF